MIFMVQRLIWRDVNLEFGANYDPEEKLSSSSSPVMQLNKGCHPREGRVQKPESQKIFVDFLATDFLLRGGGGDPHFR